MDHQVILFKNKIVFSQNKNNKMVKINIFFLLVLCLVIGTSHRVDGRHNTMKEDLELERQLKLINKPPIKSTHVLYSHVFD